MDGVILEKQEALDYGWIIRDDHGEFKLTAMGAKQGTLKVELVKADN